MKPGMGPAAWPSLIAEILDACDGPATLEHLRLRLSERTAKQVPIASLRGLLTRHPELFREDGLGNWRLAGGEGPALDERLGDGPRTDARQTLQEYIALDFETSGRDASECEIIEVGAVLVRSGVPVSRFHRFVRPTGPVAEEVLVLTNIAPEQLASGGDKHDVLRDVLEFIGGRLVVAHNAWAFDQVVLECELERCGIGIEEPFYWADTLPIARLLLPPPLLNDHRLETLAAHFDVTVTPTHRADADASALAEVVEGMRALFRQTPECVAIGELLARSGDPFGSLVADAAPAPMEAGALAHLACHNLPPLLPAEAPTPPNSGDLEDTDAAFDCLEGCAFQRREAQRVFAREVAHTQQDGGVLAAEAPTGTGKSLGYLVPAIIHAHKHNSPTVVSTHTRRLQDQIVDHEAPKLAALVRGRARISALKGMSNYIWVAGLARETTRALTTGVVSRGEAYCLGLLVRLLATSKTGTLEDVRQQIVPLLAEGSGNPHDFYAILDQCVVHRDCLNGLQDSEPYARARENALRSDIVVINHALLMTSVTSRDPDSTLVGVLSDCVVVDEAHELESAATSVLTDTVSEGMLRRLASQLCGSGRYALRGLAREWRDGSAGVSDELDAVLRAARQLDPHIEALGEAARQYVDYASSPSDEALLAYGAEAEYSAATRGAPPHSAVMQRISQMRAQLLAMEGPLSEALDGLDCDGSHECRRFTRLLVGCRERVREAARLMGRFKARSSSATGTLCSIRLSPGARGEAPWELVLAPIRVDAELRGGLFGRCRSVVLCSATLTAPGRTFDFICDRLGLSDVQDPPVRFLALDHEFDYASNVLMCLPNHLLTPRPHRLQTDYPRIVAEELTRLIRVMRGSVLALFTAKNRRDSVQRLLSDQLAGSELRVLCESEPNAIDRFRDEASSSLLAGPAQWQGLDVPGDSLRCVTISKLPFGRPFDPLEAARAADMERRHGGDRGAFNLYVLPKMIMTLKQGFGRLMRDPTDRGVVVMLDKRLRWAGYRPQVLRALPPAATSYASDTAMYREINEFLSLGWTEQDLPPKPMSSDEQLLESFRLDLPLSEDASPEEIGRAISTLTQAAAELLGIPSLRSFQERCIREVILGHDVLALAPTGHGKSLTYQLPALCRSGLTLVISPLVSLMRDQVAKMADSVIGPWVDAITYETPVVAQEEALQRARSGQLKLLYVSPERLQSPKFRDWLAGIDLAQVVVDEAHCISAWGHSFRPHYLRVKQLLEPFGDTPVQAVTATATQKVRDDIISALELGRRRELTVVSADVERANLCYGHIRCKSRDEAMSLACAIADSKRGSAGIVYCRSKADAEAVAVMLRKANIRAAHYHAGLPFGRQMIERRFMEGQLDCIAATTAFGMGVDKADIRYVVHLGPPLSVEGYVQETGRAGRDGDDALCMLLSWPKCEQSCKRIIGTPESKRSKPQELLRVLQRTRSDAAIALGDGTLLLDPLAARRATGAKGDGSDVGVSLHHLEESGVLEWLGDLDTCSAVVMNCSLEASADRIQEDHLEDFLRIARRFRFSEDETAIVDVRQCQEVAPQRVGQVLSEASRNEVLLYRPFQRMHHLRLTGRGSADAAGSRMAATIQHQLEGFERMAGYASLGKGACRVAFLESYLSGQTDSTACGRCDLCLQRPLWQAPEPERMRDFEPEPADPVWAILEAVAEAENMVGVGKFVSHLLGFPHSYYGGQPQPLPPQMLDLPCHGILSNAIQAKELGELLGAMVDLGYLARTEDYKVIGLAPLGVSVIEGLEPAPTVEELTAADD